MTEERVLEKFTLKTVKTGGQSRKRKSNSNSLNDAWTRAGRHAARCCWIGLISRTLTSTETGGRRFQLFCRTREFNETVTIRRSSSEKQEKRRSQLIDPCTYSISDSRVSRFSPSEPSSSVNPVCTKHPRQSPLCIRTMPQQCGHSSSSCWVEPRESLIPLKSIFHNPAAANR